MPTGKIRLTIGYWSNPSETNVSGYLPFPEIIEQSSWIASSQNASVISWPRWITCLLCF